MYMLINVNDYMLMTLSDVDQSYEHEFGLCCKSMILCIVYVILCELWHCYGSFYVTWLSKIVGLFLVIA